MKNLFTFCLLFISICTQAQVYNLTLTNASAAGTFQQGDSIHIWSDKTTTYQVFTHWSGDGAQYLLKDDEWHTVMIVPPGTTQSNFELTANYDALGSTSIGTITLEQWGEENESGAFFPVDKEIEFAYQQNPKAIVLFFHGTGGNAGAWVNDFEKRSMLKDFVYNGYAVLALNSNETTLGNQDGGDGKIRWETSQMKQDTNTNIDFKNVMATLDHYNSFFGELPVFAVGGSNGANFADFAAAALDFKASAHLTGNGLINLFQNHPNLKPNIWIQSINDNNTFADSTQALANYQELINQNIATEWHWLQRSPAYPKRFMRSINGIGESISTALYDSLKSQSYLDTQDRLTIWNTTADFPADDFLADFNLTTAQENDFLSQLKIINADHGSNGDFNKTIIRFFDECLAAPTAVDEAVGLAQSQSLVSPNPATNFVNINLENGLNFTYEIYNVNGLLVSQNRNYAAHFRVDVSTLTAGVYFLKIELVDGSVLVEKFVRN